MDKGRLALLIVDMQRRFAYDDVYPGASSHFKNIIQPNVRLARRAREVGVPVIYTLAVSNEHTHPRHSRWRVSGRQQTDLDNEITPELNPEPTDFKIEKCRYNAFAATELDIVLRNLKVDTLIVTGVATNVCVESTIRGAIDHDYKVVIPEDCTATTDEESKQISLTNLRNVGRGIEVGTSKDILENLLNEKLDE